MAIAAVRKRILGPDGKPFHRRGGADRGVRRVDWGSALNRYDAAQTTDENMRHWQWADSLSADAANSPQVRRVLRNRSRYEAHNNSYCRSMIGTIANDVIGTGPRVQIVTGGKSTDDAFLEREIAWWMAQAKIGKKLHTLRKAKAQDGEGIGILTTRQRLPTPVKLYLRTIEAEQMASPWLNMSANAIDGVRFDPDGEPVEYDILRHHPGNAAFSAGMENPEIVSARDVIHVFREDRPGQHRGIPEMMPALPLFSQLRRFTLATLAAAETAAEFAAVIESALADQVGMDAATDDGGLAVEAMDTFELAQRMVTVLPNGFKLSQIKAEHPATTYGEFKREILAEAFACLMMPYAVGANDSKDYNFASGKLDRRGYAKAVYVERTVEWEPEVLRIVYSWFLEAKLIKNYLPASLPPFSQWLIQLYWDEVEDDIDPVKAANAQDTKLRNHSTTYAFEYARKGRDWESELRQRAKEVALMKELGLSDAQSPDAAPPAQTQPTPDEDEEDVETE